MPASPTLAYIGPDHDGGATVLFFHGLSADSTGWAPVIARVGDDYRGFARFRGHGRSGHVTDGYRLDGYVNDSGPHAAADRRADDRGRPLPWRRRRRTTLAQEFHPLVSAVFLEDPPLYLVQPDVFPTSSFGRIFPVIPQDAITRLQGEHAPIDMYRGPPRGLAAPGRGQARRPPPTRTR